MFWRFYVCAVNAVNLLLTIHHLPTTPIRLLHETMTGAGHALQQLVKSARIGKVRIRSINELQHP